jgi:5-methylcytosine-specific restriction endonuclease McrA
MAACLQCGEPHRNARFCSYSCSNQWRAEHVSPEVLAERKERHRVKNLVSVRRYQARRAQQMPDDADQEKIKAIYAACPDGHEVDHIIPISRGGLHHQDNLQYLLKRDNRRKSNKLNWTSSQAANGN